MSEQGTPVVTPTEPTATPDATPPPVEQAPEPQQAPPGQESAPQAETPPSQEATPPTPTVDAGDNAPPERAVPAVGEYKFPEGTNPDFGKWASKASLTQDQANDVLALNQVTRQAEMQAVRDDGEALIKSWGEQGKYKMNLAQRAMKQHDPDGTLVGMLNSTGFGSHPAVLEFFVSLGQGLQEGGFLKSELKAPGEKTRAQKMFPNMKSESL